MSQKTKRNPDETALLIALMLTREKNAIRLSLKTLRRIADAPKIKMRGRYCNAVFFALKEHGVQMYKTGRREFSFVDTSLQALKRSAKQPFSAISGDICWLEESPLMRNLRLGTIEDCVNSR